MARRIPWLRRAAEAWRRHLAIRIAATVVGLSILLTAVASVFARHHEQQFLEQELERQCRQLAEVAALNCGDDLAVAYQDYTRLQDYVDAMVEEDPRVCYVRVVRKDGRQVAAAPREIAAAMGDTDVVASRCAVQIVIDGEPRELGYLQLGMSRRPWREMLAGHFWQLQLGLIGAAVIVALALIALLNRFLGLPLRRLDVHARKIGSGVLDTPVPPIGTCELQRLALTFEDMRRNLQHSYRVLASQNEELRQLARLKTEFLANMSHEIRTPLHALLGCTEDLIAPEVDTPPGIRENLQMLLRNAHQLMETVNSVLDLSKLESKNLLLQPTPVDVRKSVEDLFAKLRPTAEAKGLTLGLVCHELPERVLLDEHRFRQVVSSLLENAIKFTERGGVEVSLDYLSHAEPPQLRVHVVDSGIGIPDEFRDRLFQPFSQADGSETRRFRGSGLGLALAQRLAVALGGNLALDSQPGGGTWARLRVVAPPCARPATIARRAVGQCALAGRRVLIVDDAPDNLTILKALLRRNGAEVETAENGRIACDKVLGAVDCRQPYDLVVMDVQMPEMDGCAAVHRLREIGVRTPIVALTAHAMEQDRTRCLSAGFDDYETKPVERERLLATLQRLIQPVTAHLA